MRRRTPISRWAMSDEAIDRIVGPRRRGWIASLTLAMTAGIAATTYSSPLRKSEPKASVQIG